MATTTRTAKSTAGGTQHYPITWRAVEYAPRKRWWWFVAFGYVDLVLAATFYVFGNWSASLLSVVIGIAVFTWYLPKPRSFDFTLTRDAISIEGGKELWPLDRYKSFITERIEQGRRREPYELLVLIPKARFARAKDIFLPEDEADRAELFETLNEVVPYDESRTDARPGRVIAWMARFLRIG